MAGLRSPHQSTKFCQCLEYRELVPGAHASSRPGCRVVAASRPVVSVSSNAAIGVGAACVVQGLGPEVDPDGNALPLGAACALGVGLALTWSERVEEGGEMAYADNERGPLLVAGL